LCLQHHKEADSGAFTDDRLRALKQDPFLRRIGANVAGRFNWKREQLILKAGGGFFVRCPVFLEVAGRPIVWLTGDTDGNQLLNLDLWDADGQHVFAMRDNDWVVRADIDDLDAPPSARSLIIRAPSRDIRLSVEFTTSAIHDVRAQLHRREEEMSSQLVASYERELSRLVEQGAPAELLEGYRDQIRSTHDQVASRVDEVMKGIERGWPAPDLVTCTLEAQLPFPDPVHITASKITLPGNNTITGGVVVDCGTAIMRWPGSAHSTQRAALPTEPTPT
jgi:hypothetical protein